MRVAITHDFYEAFGGAERVTAEIAAAFPEATVYALLGRSEVAMRMGVRDRSKTVLPPRRRLLAHYRTLAPVYPWLARAYKLPAADVVISSSYAYAHTFATRNSAPKLCYCHGPFRHLWSQEAAYRSQLPGHRVAQAAFSGYIAFGRAADRAAAAGVDRFLTQSPFTAQLIQQAYGREAEILPPPIDCDLFRPGPEPPDDYFLFVGRLVEAYKRPSVVVRAFAQIPQARLVVAGDGPALGELRQIAPPNVTFVGALGDVDLVRAMQRCRAAVFPSVDDFGLVPIEVNACGRPVLAYRGGGALHTVAPGVSGEFFDAQTPDALRGAIETFDPARYDADEIRRHALQWDAGQFRRRIREVASELVATRS